MYIVIFIAAVLFFAIIETARKS